jgi:hypothetical protein
MLLHPSITPVKMEGKTMPTGPTPEDVQRDSDSELAEERRIHRERREGTLGTATDEQRARAAELKREANPEKEDSEENSEA